MHVTRIVALVGIVLLPAVSSGGTWRHDIGTTAEGDAIHQGLSAGYDAVGLLLGKTHRCSGTLIENGETNEHWVVSAAHCLDRGKAGHYTFRLGSESRTGIEKYVHQDWTGNVANGSDIALLKLDSAFGGGITPAVRRTSTFALPSEFVSVGYGLGGTGLTGATLTAVVKRAGSNFVEARGGDPGPFGAWSNTIVLNDFDHPNDPSKSTFNSNGIHKWEFNIAPGDSGGAIFTGIDGVAELAGVTSLGWARDGNVNSDYGDGGGFTDITMFNGWIDGVLAGGNTGGGGGGKGGRPPGRGKGASFNLATSVSARTLTAPIPEPSSGILIIFATLGLLPLRRRRIAK